MAYTLKDRVLVTSTSTGTGDFSLGAAVTGYQAFTVVGNGAQIPYTIQGLNPDGSQTGDWEVGIGTWYFAGNYITRDTILESSNSGSKVAFPSGDKNVFLDLPGELVVQGPNSATASNFVAFDGTSGKIIKDSGFSSASFATAAQGAKADTAVQQSVVGQPNGVASLDAGGQVPLSQIPPLGDLNYQGTWNAATNTPTLTSSVGTKGYYYVVSVAGTTNLNGITDWQPNDWAVFNGSVWQKIDNTDAVTSVNGYTGAVVLTQPDIAGTVPTSRTISTGTGLIGGGDLSANRTISFSTASVGTWAANPTSANLSAAMTDETGSGSLVFNTSPLLVTPTLSGATVDNAAPYIDWTGTTAPSYVAGRTWYDSASSSLSYYNNTTNNVVHLGQEIQQQVRNSTGSTITKGSVVYISGATGQIGNITLAQANSYTASQVIGVANQDIPNNTNGWIVTQGTVTNFNTSGLTEGANIYLSASTPGALTSTEPSTPNYAVHMGTCLYSNTNNGKIYICPINKSIDTGYIIGQIAVAQGGTGAATLTGYVKGNGTSAFTASATVPTTDLSGTISNAQLTNSSVTYNGVTVALGASGTITAANPNALTAGTGLSYTGGGTYDGSAAKTLNLANTTVTAGSYTYGSFTVDAQGRITAASSGTAPVTTFSAGTTGFTPSSATSGAITLAGTLNVANGGTGATSAGAAIANLFGFTSTATAAGTTALTNTSTFFQLFTGTTTQTVTLPVVSTLAQGWRFNIVNTSTGTVTVNSSGGNLVYAIPTNGAITVACIATTGTTAAAWVLADSTTAVWNA